MSSAALLKVKLLKYNSGFVLCILCRAIHEIYIYI